MTALRTWGGPILALVAVALEVGTWPSPRVSLAFALAAVVVLGRWSSLCLGLVAVVTVVLPSAPVGADLEGWLGLVLSGLGLGLLARSAEPGLARLFSGARRVGTATWFSLLAVALVFLPDGHVALFDANGELMSFSVVVEDAVTGVRGIQELPAYLASPHPADAILSWILFLGPITAFALLAQSIAPRSGLLRAGWILSRITGSLLVVSALWGVAELLGGSVAVPSAAELGETLSELAGGRASITAVSTPEGASLTLASRPLVDVLRLALGIPLLVWPSMSSIDPPARRPAGPWLTLSLACAVATCFVLGPAPCAWTVAGAGVCGTAALIHGRMRGTDDRWFDDLQLLTLGMWVSALIAPAVGWVARI